MSGKLHPRKLVSTMTIETFDHDLFPFGSPVSTAREGLDRHARHVAANIFFHRLVLL